jgi:hypothetical protein
MRATKILGLFFGDDEVTLMCDMHFDTIIFKHCPVVRECMPFLLQVSGTPHTVISSSFFKNVVSKILIVMAVH